MCMCAHWLDRYVRVIAGTVVSALNGTLPGGCPSPCLMGVQGYNDGPRNATGFSYPQDVAIGENGTVCGAQPRTPRPSPIQCLALVAHLPLQFCFTC